MGEHLGRDNLVMETRVGTNPRQRQGKTVAKKKGYRFYGAHAT